MKRFFISLGKALLYFLVFFGMQFAVPFFYLVFKIVLLTAVTASDGIPDLTALINQAMAAFTDNILLLTLLSNLLTIGVYCLSAPIRQRSLREHLFLLPMDRRGILPTVLLGLSANLALSLIIGLIPFPEQWLTDYEAASGFLPDDMSLIGLLSVAVIAPVTEELCFRGLMYTRLRQGMPAVLAAVISSAVFGAVHGNLLWFFYAFPLGLLMIWILHRFHSLWASILFHAAFNLISLILTLVPEDAWLLLGLLVILGCIATVVCIVWIARLTKPAQQTDITQ